MDLKKTSILLTVLFSFSVMAQVGTDEIEKKMLKNLEQSKALDQQDIKKYLQGISKNRESRVEVFQQKYQDQLMNKIEQSDDPMVNEMQLKDVERRLENIKEQFEKASLEPTKTCPENSKQELLDLNLQVKNICKKIKP